MAVTPESIAVALGRTPPPDAGSPEYEQWTLWISDALMLIETRLGAEAFAALDQAKLDYVVREAVVAHIQHPEDTTSVQVSVDDGSMSKRYSSSPGRVHIIDEWWTLLSPASNGRAFSIRPSGSTIIHLDWCSLSMGALYCSCGADIAGYPIYEGG